MNDLDRTREALSFIPAVDRDLWVKMGMAVKAELGEPGFVVWDDWSQQADNYDAHDARDVWKSIKSGGKVTGGTLFHEAKANGWRDDGTYHKPTPEEIADRQRKAAEQAAKEEAETARQRKQAATWAAAIWKASTAPVDNPYLVRKKVSSVATLREIEADKAAPILGYVPKSGGEPLTGRLLVVPVKVGNELSTCELIDGEKRKHALFGGGKIGGYWAAQPMPEIVDTLLIGEGAATVLSAREGAGYPAVAALSSNNLGQVAKAMRDRYPVAVLVFLVDLVKATGEPDPHALKAAQAVGGLLAVPDFGANRDPDMKDFNDLAQVSGLDAVRVCIEAAKAPNLPEHQTVGDDASAGDSDSWPEPLPLTAKVDPEPYPLDALPDTIRAAVEEVAGFVKAPLPLVASSALAALSLACQAHIDVKRAEKLSGPVGLFLLTIADSGERKSTCDGFFISAIRQYEAEQEEAAKPLMERYKATAAAWQAEYDGILSAIKEAGKKGKSTDQLRADLGQLKQDEPEAPRVTRLLLGDETPENLAWSLAKKWPSAGVVSSEAGLIFGSHGMSGDSVMRNLGLLNVLWDGGAHSVGRRTSESFTVRGARLTVALQIQEATLRSFFDKSGGLARGTGFLARFLVAWPESTQGYRPFTEAPPNWPHLAAFHRRIASILENPAPLADDGSLSPVMLTMTPEAKSSWVSFHDAIEAELISGGELCDVKDVASKSADNAVRLAALFQMFEHGMGAISLESFESASRIAAWHLNEARRFFGELALPAELADAARLDGWLIDHCRRERTTFVSKRHARQHGPLRDKARLDGAIAELSDLERVRFHKDGKKLTLQINPALLEVAR